MDPFARTLVPIPIQDEMRNAYMDYSMSVIIGRALPDVRDGLKPVHRRILYAMHSIGLLSNKKYSKCAGVVGEVLKRLHPHGDSAVYDALVRMAQPWNLRYMLVDGQGNFGSVDGDPPAAYRYTECRMTKLSEELLTDIDKETVDFSPNFDGVDVEPDVLPCRFPNLLVNGTEGIAVGMATKIPPHNLAEIINACVAVIEDPTITSDDLVRNEVVLGPDFPTYGSIYGVEGVLDAYRTGKGRVVIRGKAEIEEQPSGRKAIVITEIPYQVNLTRLIEGIADLVKTRRVEGIATLRNESDRQGMRVVVELKRDAFPEVVLNHLYKHTALQTTFGVHMLAIVNNRPRTLGLVQMLQHFIAHRREVILRRTRYELRKARERAHIVEGFLKALDIIDEIIALIRASDTVADARDGLVTRFGFSEIQAQAILDMRLQRLTALERLKLQQEYDELMERISYLEAILATEERLMEVVREELEEIRDLYGDRRRTQVLRARSELTMHDLVAEEDQIVTLSHLGYIKRCKPDEWRTQRRGGVGKRGMSTRNEDFVTSIFVANTHSTLLVFTDKGTVLPLQVYDVPEASRDAKGRPIINLVPVPKDERVSAVVSVRDMEEEGTSLLFVSRQGLVKRTPLQAFKNLRQGGMRASGVADGDALLLVRVLDSDADVMLFTRKGKCIRFNLEDVPVYGRTARGNLGIQLADGDEVVDVVLAPAVDAEPMDADAEDPEESDAISEVDAISEDDAEALDESADEITLLTATDEGFGKRTRFDAYRVQGRNGKGIISVRLSEAGESFVSAIPVRRDDQVMLVTNTGRVIRIRAASVRLTVSRSAHGVRLMRLENGERIVDLARLQDADDVDAIEEATPELEDGAGGSVEVADDTPSGDDAGND